MRIQLLHDSKTIRYAAEELKKYLAKMSGVSADISKDNGDIKLGFLSELELSLDGVLDSMIDDVIDVRIEGLSGYIAGSNERSILMGVYNYFKSAGAMWGRPGENGEFIPQIDLSLSLVRYAQKGGLFVPRRVH